MYTYLLALACNQPVWKTYMYTYKCAKILKTNIGEQILTYLPNNH